jgi:hypothetical protein
MACQYQLLVAFAEITALANEFFEVCVLFNDQGMNPGEIEPDLQIAQFRFLESAQCRLGRQFSHIPAGVQFSITRIRQDHVLGIGEEKIVEQKKGLFFAEVCRGNFRNFQKTVRPFMFRIAANLFHQARNEVNRATHFWNFLQM